MVSPTPTAPASPPFSLYIHIPYCQAKCPYCDFNSYAASIWPEEEYVAAVLRELAHYAELEAWRGGEIQTIFFGGGTPSLFAAPSIARILDNAAKHWHLAANREITLESNPGTVDVESLRALRAAGINRISFGVQSFWPHHLERLGRIHSGEQAREAIIGAQVAGFESINLDLIFALPEQTLAEWESDLCAAVALGTQHVSAYNLTYEEGTPFHAWRAQGKLRQLDDDVEAKMFEMGQDLLGAAGYVQYEISNYAQPGAECRHNLNYWRSGTYLGVGAGAHSYAQQDGAGTRWSNEKNPLRYMSLCQRTGHARATQEVLSLEQQRGEHVFLGLRCREGFAEERFKARFGVGLAAAFPDVATHVGNGLLECVGGRWRLTADGLRHADKIFLSFV